MKKTLNKTIITTALLLILAFSLTSNTFLVSGEAGGTGKFLGIIFEAPDTDALRASDCSVIATKVRSDQVFLFNATDDSAVAEEGEEPISLNKVGAGTVLLEAKPGEAWNFIGFSVVDGEALTVEDNKAWYKPVKYGKVEATFEIKEIYDIEVTVVSENEDDYVETTIDGVLYKIKGGDSFTIEGVIAGATPFFKFEAATGNHISVFAVTTKSITTVEESALDYTFESINAHQKLTVFFSTDGEAYIPDFAEGVPISLGDEVTLNFDTISNGGTAIQGEIVFTGELIDLDRTSLLLWNVDAEFVEFTGATVGLPIDVTKPTIKWVFTSNDLEALYSDVDGDGKVTHADMNAVAIAIASNGREYDPMYDVNMDGSLDSADIHKVQEYMGTTLEQLLDFETIDGIIYINTEHFSIFRCR